MKNENPNPISVRSDGITDPNANKNVGISSIHMNRNAGANGVHFKKIPLPVVQVNIIHINIV